MLGPHNRTSSGGDAFPAEWTPPLISFRPDCLPPPPVIEDPSVRLTARRHISAHPLHGDGRSTPAERDKVDLWSNRRLEWKGDALLSWLVSAELYERFPEANQGDLTWLLRQIVANSTLAFLAWHYGLHLTLESAQTRAGHPTRFQKNIADAFEAHIAAAAEPVSSHGNMTALQHFIRDLLAPDCAVGLEELARNLREQRLLGRDAVDVAYPGNSRRQFPIAGAPAPASNTVPSSLGSTSVTSVEVQHRGSWVVSLQLDGFEIAKATSIKRHDASRLALTDLVERLGTLPGAWRHLQTHGTPVSELPAAFQ